MDQPGNKVLPILLVVSWTGEKRNFSLSPFAPKNLAPRDGFGRPVPRPPAHTPHSGWIWLVNVNVNVNNVNGAYSRDSSRFPRRRPFILYRHTASPSDQPLVFRVTTQLRTDGLHCRESASTGPVVVLYCTVLYCTVLYCTVLKSR